MCFRSGPYPIVLTVLLAFTIAPVRAETSCKTDGCSSSCSLPANVAISELIGPAAWPNIGGTTYDVPMKFLDMNDGSGRFLIATQRGMVLVWDGAAESPSISSTPFLDLNVEVLYGGERGLLSMVLDPEFVTNGHFYVFYTRDGDASEDGDIVIERYTRDSNNSAIADKTTALTIMVIDHPSSNHNGGDLAFGPDGFLYISTGDSGGSCDGNQGASGDGQSPSTLHGKMLRIDVRGIDAQATAPDDCGVVGEPTNYTIPFTNPFRGQEPACDEVWDYGLRNPFRFSFDRVTGDVYVGDVGQNNWEEINLRPQSQAAPMNFGWSCREGCEPSNVGDSGCSTTGCQIEAVPPSSPMCQFPRTIGDGSVSFWDPVLCHETEGGEWQSIMGGYRYRGNEVPALDGDYLYSDAACGQLWGTTTLDPGSPGAIDATCLAAGYGGIYGFGEDAGGELYLVVGGQSRILCVHDGDGCDWAGGRIFTDGFESGDTARWN